MKKYLRFAENYILLLASATLGLFLLLFAPRDGGVSETENRALQAFPELKGCRNRTRRERAETQRRTPATAAKAVRAAATVSSAIITTTVIPTTLSKCRSTAL